MDNATWDFDAPEFVDFNSDEHEKDIGRESYFDYDHERLRSEGMTVEEFKKIEIFEQENVNVKNNSRRLTFDTPKATRTQAVVVNDAEALTTPSTEAILSKSRTESEVFEDAPESGIVNMTLNEKGSSGGDEATQTSQNANIFEEKKAPPLLPNIMTPSRLAAWENAKKLRATNQANQRRRSRRLAQMTKEARRSNNDGQVSKNSEKASKPLPKDDGPPAKKSRSAVHLSVARTPTVLKHKRHGSVSKVKSSAELEMEEIERVKKEQKKRLKESSSSFKAALKGPSPRPPTPSKITKAKEFKFRTDERLKSSHSMETRSAKLSSEVDFTKELRKHTPTSSKMKTTEVKPFNLSSSNRKRKIEFEKDHKQMTTEDKPFPFKLRSQRLLYFQDKNPKPGQKGKKGPMKAVPMFTHAQTPKLLSKTRVRAISVMSAEEKEELEVAELKNHQFKAKPANREILEHPDPLPDIPKKETTKTEEFKLHIKKQVEEKPKHDKSPSPDRQFKARPVPKTLYEGPLNVEKHGKCSTIPQSPAFLLKNRMQMAQIRKENKAIEEKENAKPQPAPRTPVRKPAKKAEVPEKRILEAQPFSFDERDKDRLAKKEAKIREIHEANRQKANSFRAQPMVFQSDPAGALPAKMKRPSTKAEPFQLISDARGNAKVEKWKAQIEKETEQLKAMTKFKANTSYTKVLSQPGFQPVHTAKGTSDFKEFNLHTNTRAMKRQEFEEWQKERESAYLASLDERKKRDELAEQEEIKKLRKSAEHKAGPIKKYKELVITESEKPPTIPESPNFSDRFYRKIDAADV